MFGGVDTGRGAICALAGALVMAGGDGACLGGAQRVAWAAAPEGPASVKGSRGTPPASTTELPRLRTSLRPAYPEGATGEAVVRLEVVVGLDGAAQSIRLVSGSPPFSTAAMAAAVTAAFEPARKGGQPVVARFLLDVHVAPPVAAPPARGDSAGTVDALARADEGPVASAAPSGSGARTSPRGAASAGEAAPMVAPVTKVASAASVAHGASSSRGAQPIEVQVDGDRAPPSTAAAGGTAISRAVAARTPGAFGDTFRAVETLPGVTPYVSGLPYFFVRGATPTTTGYLLDGVTVPLLFHVGGGPAVIAASMLSGVDFHPGGYPVIFGRQTGGIVAGRSATPAARFSAEATLRLMDASALVTAPLPDGRGVAFAAGRTSFTQAVVPLITPDVSLGYWDYQAGASVRISADERVRLLAFGADDFLAQKIGGAFRPLYKAQFHRVDLAYERAPEDAPRARVTGSAFGESDGAEAMFTEPSRVRVAATLGFDRSHLVGQGDLSALLGQVRASVEVPLHSTLRVRAGADLLTEGRSLERVPVSERPVTDDGSFAETFGERTFGTFGAFAELTFAPRPFVELVAGVRADLFGDPNGGAVGVDPRLAARVALLSWLTSVTTFGVAHQRPSFVVPLPGVAPASSELVLQEALHVSQGVELRLPSRWAAQATGYFHEHHHLTDYLTTCWRGERQDECRFFARAEGRSYGLELLVQRALTERLGAQVAYTLSRSERSMDGETFAADTDRTHVVHVIFGYEPLPGLHAGVRITAYSGRPFTLAAGKRNVARGPAFFRLDLRASKTWRLGGTAHVTAAFEGLNVTLAKEMIDVDCRSPVEIGLACGRQEIGPITIPSVGLSGGF